MTTAQRFWISLFTALGLDGATKAWAERTLFPLEPVPLLGDALRLFLCHNWGVALGVLYDLRWGPLILSGAGLVAMAAWAARSRRSHPRLPAWPFALVFGGAAGNFVDRAVDGYVTDFLDVGLGATHRLTFNLADVFIALGAGLLVLTAFLPTGRRPVDAPNP